MSLAFFFKFYALCVPSDKCSAVTSLARLPTVPISAPNDSMDFARSLRLIINGMGSYYKLSEKPCGSTLVGPTYILNLETATSFTEALGNNRGLSVLLTEEST